MSIYLFSTSVSLLHKLLNIHKSRWEIQQMNITNINCSWNWNCSGRIPRKCNLISIGEDIWLETKKKKKKRYGISGLGILKNCNEGNLEAVSTNYKAEKEPSLALGFCMNWGDQISKKNRRMEVRTSSGPGSLNNLLYNLRNSLSFSGNLFLIYVRRMKDWIKYILRSLLVLQMY